MWSDALDCLTCKHGKKLIETDYPTLVENAYGCALHGVILPLYQRKGLILCRDCWHWNTGKKVTDAWWPSPLRKMKDGILYSTPNSYDPTLTEICEIRSLPKIPESN